MSEQYRVYRRKNAEIIRESPTLVKVENQIGNQILAIGGFSDNNRLRSVSSHILLTDTWVSNLPQLNQNRLDAGSCVCAGQVYIFAGEGDSWSQLTSIEKISVSSLIANGRDTWLTFEMPQSSSLSPRCNPAVAPLNDNEIAIMGGRLNDKWFVDVVVFNTRSKKCQQMVAGEAYKFQAASN